MIVKSLEQLTSLSKKVAENLSENDLIYLVGEIGVGKTTFVKYLINNLQKHEKIKITEIPSPTFNIVYEYRIKKKRIQHFDLYRLKKKEKSLNIDIFK